jgi:hypothetical protein
MRKNIAKIAASVAAVAAIGAGAAVVSGADTSSTAGSDRAGDPPGMAGGGPGGGPPGTEVTGAEAERVEAAVTKRYPGTIERVMEAPDGGYMTMVTESDGTRLMVRVSEDLEVLDAREGGPDGGPPPDGAAPGDGAASSS